tara:strand:- start:1077 stop:1928 length:852 start_codon:yes stop_codon:yes gene_type:complete
MSDNKIDKSASWKNWIIKKLLSNQSTKEEILNYIASDSIEENKFENFDDNNENNLIKNILLLNEQCVEDVMVPRGEIISIEKNQSYAEILSIIKNESHSRMPVFEQNLDNLLGFFHIKDFIKANKNDFDISLILRDVLFVAPKSPILDLLKRMRSSRIHMGLVVDEFGGVDGLVTIEDLVEEIVGEIEDEHDAEDVDDLILSKNKNSIIVEASYRIDDLEKYFNIKINNDPDLEIDTIGGLIFSKINRIPKNNESFEIEKLLNAKIIKASERKILTIKISKAN